MAKRFPSASRGLKQLFTSEILMIIGSILIGIAMSLVGFYGLNADNAASAIAILTFSSVGAIIALIGAIMQLVGMHTAGKDSRRFKNAFAFMILAIVVALVAAAMNGCWPTVFGAKFMILTDAAVNVIELVAVYFVMTGIRDLALASAKPKIAALANGIWTTYCVVIIASALVALLALVNVAEWILGIIAAVVIVVALIADIAYLVLLYRAKKAIR